MPETTGTRSIRWYSQQTPPDDEEDAEDRAREEMRILDEWCVRTAKKGGEEDAESDRRSP